MNQTMTDMMERRSVRKFKPDPIDKELIEQIVNAGLYAANGRGKQATRIIAVTNKELRDELAKDNQVIGGWKDGFDPFYGAPVVLIVLGDKESATRVYDGSLVMGNLMLAAHTLGIGSCWVHRAKEAFEMDKYKALLAKLGIEGKFEGIGHCILGYPDGEAPQAAPRAENRVFYAE